MKKSHIILLTFIFAAFTFFNCEKSEKVKETSNSSIEEISNFKILNKEPSKNSFVQEIVEYEIINIKDLSRKAFGRKILSEYKITEIENLPINKKILYKIVLDQDVKESQIKPTVEEIVNQLKSDDPDIDEIILWLYSTKDISNGTYDIGTAIWAPFGKLGNVNAKIAENNNREHYNVEYRIKKNLDEYLIQKLKSEVKFGLTEDERKQIFKDIVSAEDKAYKYRRFEEDKVFESNMSKNQIKTELIKIDRKVRTLIKKYTLEVLKKYKITEQQEAEISREAFDESWPLD